MRSVARAVARSSRPILPAARSLAPVCAAAPLGARGFRATVAARADVKIADLHALSTQALVAEGYSREEAAVLLDVMMWAQLRGYGPGVAEIAGGAVAKTASGGPMEVTLETKLSTKIDGKQENGMLVLHRAVGIAVEKAKAHGVGLVGTSNTSSSAGALGYYLETIAQQGLVGLVLAQSPELVSPLCTNPIGVAVPSPRGPMIVDLAAAASQIFGLDSPDRGAPTALQRAISTFDKSYKGSHLSLTARSSSAHFGAMQRTPLTQFWPCNPALAF